MRHASHKSKEAKPLSKTDYAGSTRRTISEAVTDSMAGVGSSPKTVQGNPRTGMGTPGGKGQKPGAPVTAGSFSSGRSRTNRGKNNITRGPQGMHG